MAQSRTITRYRLVHGVVQKETITCTPNDRPSDYEKTMLEGSLADRVMRGYRDLESEKGSQFTDRLPYGSKQIRQAWAEPGVSAPA